MKSSRRDALTGIAAGAASLILPGNVWAQTGFDGDYGGVLDLGDAKLRLRLVIAGDTATLYSLDQGNSPIPASKVERKDDLLLLEFDLIKAKFEGRLEGSVLSGTFYQGRPIPVRLERGVIPVNPKDLSGLLGGTMNQTVLDQIRVRLGTPGMTVGWQRGNGAVMQLRSGLRAAGHPELLRQGDLWHIGSISKSFTATLFARAVQGGAIQWDTALGALLPDTPEQYRALTAIELFSHHAGLPANVPIGDLLALPRTEKDPRISRRRFAASAMAQPRLGKPQSRFAYSNVGYVLAAIMLENATGKSWEQLIAREVLRPLGLKSAGFGPPGSAKSFDQPRGHVGGAPVYLDNPVAMAPAGGLHISMADLLRYLAAHRDKPKFLGAAQWKELHTARFGSAYALGWFVGKDGGLWHNGSNTAWYAEVRVEPTSGLVAASCNNDTALVGQPRVLFPPIRRAAGVPA
jgi:D-alanyl-D-alanine carboxypeptidase